MAGKNAWDSGAPKLDVSDPPQALRTSSSANQLNSANPQTNKNANHSQRSNYRPIPKSSNKTGNGSNRAKSNPKAADNQIPNATTPRASPVTVTESPLPGPELVGVWHKGIATSQPMDRNTTTTTTTNNNNITDEENGLMMLVKKNIGNEVRIITKDKEIIEGILYAAYDGLVCIDIEVKEQENRMWELITIDWIDELETKLDTSVFQWDTVANKEGYSMNKAHDEVTSKETRAKSIWRKMYCPKVDPDQVTQSSRQAFGSHLNFITQGERERGIGITFEALEIFSRLKKTWRGPIYWDDQTLVVEDIFKLSPPYKIDNVIRYEGMKDEKIKYFLDLIPSGPPSITNQGNPAPDSDR